MRQGGQAFHEQPRDRGRRRKRSVYAALVEPPGDAFNGAFRPHAFSTNESITRFSPALSKATVSLLPSIWITSP